MMLVVKDAFWLKFWGENKIGKQSNLTLKIEVIYWDYIVDILVFINIHTITKIAKLNFDFIFVKKLSQVIKLC